MNRKIIKTMIAVFAMVLLLAGCSTKPVLVLDVFEDGKGMTATFNKAKPGDFAMSGSLVVEDGDVIKINSALEGEGKVTFKLISTIAGEDIGEEELKDLADQDPVVELSISSNHSMESTVPSGDYYVNVTVDKKATGTVDLAVEATGSAQMPNPWTDVATGEEAAQGAGLDTFVVPEGAVIGLGEIKVDAYRYMDGIAEAYIPFPAVDMTIRKGYYAGDGDISGDYNTYANMWTQNIKGLEVNCYGNREGEATKTVFVSGDYSYTITAYGLGGDTDYGLSADDLNSIINGLQ